MNPFDVIIKLLNNVKTRDDLLDIAGSIIHSISENMVKDEANYTGTDLFFIVMALEYIKNEKRSKTTDPHIKAQALAERLGEMRIDYDNYKQQKIHNQC